MRTYTRINEDYLDTVSKNELIYNKELSMSLEDNIWMLKNGQTPNIDFNFAPDALYLVSNEELSEIIKLCI